MLSEEFKTLIFNKQIFISKSNLKYKKIFFDYIRELITLILILIGRNYYISSLKGCNGDEFLCLRDIKYIYDGFEKCIKSSIIFILILFSIQIKISKTYNLIIVLFFFIEFLFKDRGSTFSNHGILNLYGFFIILFFGEVLILIILIFFFFFIEIFLNRNLLKYD